MSIIKYLKDKFGNQILPITKEKCIYSETSERLDNKLQTLHIGEDGKPILDYLTVGSRFKDSVIGKNSTSEGFDNTVSGDYTHAEGESNKAIGRATHSEGSTNISSGDAAHSEGYSCKANGHYSHAEGTGTTATGLASHVEGQYGTAKGSGSHTEGISNGSIGDYSHVEGENNIVNGQSSHGEGGGNAINGNWAHAEGGNGYVRSNYSHAEGQACVAGGSDTDKTVGTHAHAEGYSTQALGNYSHAEGRNTIASGLTSHAGGTLSTAATENSFAHGLGVGTWGSEQVVFGRYNVIDGSKLFIIGNGTSESARSNAVQVDTYGNLFTSGEIYCPTIHDTFLSTNSVAIKENYSFVKRAGNLCILTIDVRTTALPAWSDNIAFTLNDGFRPSYDLITILNSSANAAVNFYVLADGRITIIPFGNLTDSTIVRGQVIYFRG